MEGDAVSEHLFLHAQQFEAEVSVVGADGVGAVQVALEVVLHLALVSAPIQLVALQLVTGVDHVIAIPALVDAQSIGTHFIEAGALYALGG